MPTFYMTGWSAVMILLVCSWRVRSWGKLLLVAGISIFVLMLSQSLFIQLAISAGLDPSAILHNPADFLAAGLFGWLALLVMPWGWFGPFVGLSIVQRLGQQWAG